MLVIKISKLEKLLLECNCKEKYCYCLGLKENEGKKKTEVKLIRYYIDIIGKQ